MIVIVIVWATQPATPGKQIEIPSKQMLSLTFLQCQVQSGTFRAGVGGGGGGANCLSDYTN